MMEVLPLYCLRTSDVLIGWRQSVNPIGFSLLSNCFLCNTSKPRILYFLQDIGIEVFKTPKNTLWDKKYLGINI